MSLKNYSDEDLAKEVERRKRVNGVPKQFRDIDFQPVVSLVEHIVNSVADEGHPGKDHDHYVFEAVVECMYPKEKFWKWWNKNARY